MVEATEVDYNATKQAWDTAKTDLNYAGGTKEYKQAYKQAFSEQHPLGSQVIGEEEVADTGYASQAGTQLKQGLLDTLSSIRTAGSARTGSTNLAEMVARSDARRSGVVNPDSLKATHASIAAETKRHEQTKTVEDKVFASIRTIIATGKEVVQNPTGVGLLATRSLPNVIAPIAGAVVGSPGGPLGSLAGMFSGSYTVEEGAAIQEGITKELHTRKLPVTEENVQTIINDKKLFDDIKAGASRKAVGTAGTDVLLGGVIGRATSVARGASRLKNLTTKTKAVAAETLSEPVSEAVGQLARSGEVDAGELMAEALGGIGSGPIMAPVDVAAFGVKKLSEPKKTKPIEEVRATQISKAPTEHKYKEKVAGRVETGKVDDIADPTSDTYNPIMHVEVLQKINKKEETPGKQLENKEQADKVFTILEDHRQSLIAKAREISQNETPTESDEAEMGSLLSQIKSTRQTLETIHPLIKSMGIEGVDQATVLRQISDAVNSDDDQAVKDSILSVFGSKRGSDLTESNVLTDILDNPKISSEVKEQVKLVQKYQESEKAMDDVNTDIIEGSPGFRGIKDYSQAITVAIKEDNKKVADTQLQMLKSFAERHTLKADTFVKVYEANSTGTAIPVDVSTQMEVYNTTRMNQGYQAGYDLSTPEARELVETINLEATALNNAVTMMGSLVPTPVAPVSATDDEITTGSGTTEVASDVAAAKVEDAEDSTRTVVSEEAVKDTGKKETPIKPIKEITPEIEKQLAAIGLRESEIKKLSPEKATLVLKYGNMSNKELSAASKSVSKDSVDAGIIKSISIVRNRTEEVVEEDSSLQVELTTPVEEDPDNQVKETFKPKKSKGLLQETPNVLHVLDPDTLRDSGVFSEKNPMDDDAVAVIDSIKEFGDEFNTAFNKEFKVINRKDFRFTNPIQYLLDADDVPPENLINTLMAVSYKWVAARSSETVHNYDEQIWAILGMDKDSYINTDAYNLLGDLGVTANMLQESLGKEALQLLGIKPSDTTDLDTQNKLELSLGLQAIATMQAMGILTQKDVLNGATPGKESSATTGLIGLKNSQQEDNPAKYADLKSNFIVPKGKDAYKSYKGQGFATFYRIATENNTVDPDIHNSYIEPYRESKNTWDLLFKGEPGKRNYSWDTIPKSKGSMQLKGADSNFIASDKQQKNIENSMDETFNLSRNTAMFYLLLDKASLGKIQGKRDISTAHVTEEKTVNGVNFGIDRSDRLFKDWLHEASKQNKGLDTPFRIPAEFWRQGRMGQIGEINPQGNKDHRFLFHMTEWDSTYDITVLSQKELFMEAVSLGLDIEVSKEDGLGQAIIKTQELLETPVMQDALKAIQTIQEGQGPENTWSAEDMAGISNLYVNEMGAITAGVLKGGLKIHTLKTLVEYNRYRQAVANEEGTFTSDLPTEIDGVSNGIIMARTQLMTDSANVPETLTALQNGGIFFANTKLGLAEHLGRPLSQDAYQSTGFTWTGALVDIERKLVEGIFNAKSPASKRASEVELRQLTAMKKLFGEFRDTKSGQTLKIARTLSKGPTMQTTYGMGEPALVKELRETFVANTYTKIMDIVADNDVDALRDLNNQLKDITGRYIFKANAVDGDNINGDVVRSVEFTTEDIVAIKNTIEAHHGAALGSSINNIYGSIKEAFAGLNGGIGVSAVMYNVALKLKIEQAEYANNGKKLTVGDIQAIEKSVENMYPYTTTPFGEKIPLTKRSKVKNYSFKAKGIRNKEVLQTYQTLPSKKAAPYKITGVESPGVGGTVLSVHIQDSVIANTIMGSFPILNNHDGFTIGPPQAVPMGQSANQTFFETMKDYHMGEEIATAVHTVSDEFNKAQSELIKAGMNQQDINIAMASEFKAMKTFGYTDAGGKYNKITPDNYQDAIKSLFSNMDRIASETKKNKKILTDAMVSVEQYSYPGAEYTTGNKSKYLQFGDQKYSPFTITEEAEARLTTAMEATNEVASAIAELQVKDTKASPANVHLEEAEKLINKGSSTGSVNMSTDPKEYALRQEISSMNVSDVYNNIKNRSTVIDSPEHDQRLQDVLTDIVQGVMDPVDLFLKSNPEIEPEGVFVHTGSARDRVFVTSQNSIIGPISGALSQGIRMSTGEVYTHELLHSVLHLGLKMNKRLRAKVTTLFDIAKRELGADGYKAFLSDPNTTNQFEIDAAKDRYDYIFRNSETSREADIYNGIEPTTGVEKHSERSNYIDEFITFANTNRYFNEALTGIKLDNTSYAQSSWKGIIGANIQETLGNIAQLVMDFFYKKFTSSAPAASMDQELKNLAIRLSQKDSDQKSNMYLALEKFGKYTNKVSTYGNAFIKDSVNSWPIVKTVNSLRDVLTTIKSSDTNLGQRLREADYAYHRLDQGIVKSTVDEVRGRTGRVAWLHALLSRRQIFLDTAKQNEVSAYMAEAADLFKRELTTEEKTAVTQIVLKTDLSVLNNSLGLEGVVSLFKNPKGLTKQIDSIISKLHNDTALSPYSTYYRRGADGLGFFMNHSRKRADDLGYQSTMVIAALKNTEVKHTLTQADINRADKLIDQLASLYAIKYSDSSQKQAVLALLEEDSKAINGVMRMHEILKEKSLRDSFNNNKFKFIKGYTKEILNSRIDIKYGLESDKEVFNQQGYSMVLTEMPRDPEDGLKHIPIHMYVSRNAKVNDLRSTIMSYLSNTAKGTDFAAVARNAGWAEASVPFSKGHTTHMSSVKSGTTSLMFDPKYDPDYSTTGNYMVPQVDDNGDITQYRYMMAETTKNNYLEQITEFDKVLGAMAGQIVDKVRSPVINKELVEGLHAVYKDGYKNNPQGFVEISAHSEDKRLREIYNMIPAKTQKDIKNIWGAALMVVPKDFIDLSFGYRQYSATEAFVKNSTDRNNMEKMLVGVSSMMLGESAAGKIGSLETLVTELTKITKSNIIIKSLHVTLGNLGSNLVYLRSRGVSIATIMKLGWEAVAYGNKYQIDAKKLDSLQLKKDILEKGSYTSNQMKEINSEIARIKDSLTRNPTTITIQAGLMPSLIDDVETITSGTNFPTEFEKKVTKLAGKLPTVVQNVGKVLVLTEDTQAYKALNNAVKMTDFIGRHVLYNHYISQGMDHKEAVVSAEDEFVNFNVPTHKMIEYGNQIGLLWFTKYGLRILKVIKDSAVNKPFDVFMTYMLSMHTGLDNILNSIPGVTKDILSPVGNPFEAFTDSLNEPITMNSIEEVLK